MNRGINHGGNFFAEARKNNLNKSNIIDASASLVPFYPKKIFFKSIFSDILDENFKYYPDRDFHDFINNVASFHNVNNSQILPGNGASELFTWIAKYAALQGSSCLPSPGFMDYERALKNWGASYIYEKLPLEYFSSFETNISIKSNTDVIWITNPHNPTGHLWSLNSLLPLLEKYKLVICDESFLPIVKNGEKNSLIPYINSHKNLLVVRSLTKLFSLPGLRIGYVIGSPEKIEFLKTSRDPWPMNCFALSIGINIMKEKNFYNKWITKVHKWLEIEREFLQRNICIENNLKAYDSSANFFLIKGNSDLSYLRDKLLSKGILVRDCRSFIYLDSTWIRISIQSKKNNKKIIKSFREILN